MQKKKISAYFQAKKLIDEKGYDIRRACKEAKVSAMTFYKYKDMFGDNEPNEKGLVEVLPKGQKGPKQSTIEIVERRQNQSQSELDRIIAENAALAEQLKLRQELAKYGH